MKIAIYPGSFNPSHVGHERVVLNALGVFDKVILAIGINPAKPPPDIEARKEQISSAFKLLIQAGKVEVISFSGLLADYINKLNGGPNINVHAVIKGLRNGADLEDEKTQLYHNQDLGIGIPTLYIIADRDVQHVSSTAIRAIASMRGK